MSDDDYWVEEFSGLTLVAMRPGHAMAYQQWLWEAGLYLFRVPPGDEPEENPIYGIGFRPARPRSEEPPPPASFLG